MTYFQEASFLRKLVWGGKRQLFPVRDQISSFYENSKLWAEDWLRLKVKISHKTCDNERFCKKKKIRIKSNPIGTWRIGGVRSFLSNANKEKITDDIYREQRCETTLECAEQKKGVTKPKFLRERSLFKSSGWFFSIIHLINSVHKLFIALL